MAITLGDAILFLRGDSKQLDKDLDNAEKKTTGWAGGLGKNIAKLTGAAVIGGIGAVIGAVTGIGAAALAAGLKLDEAFDNIVVNTGATGAELDILKNDFREVFRSVPVDAKPASDVIAALNTRLGLTGQSLQDLARPLLEASRLLGGDAKTNAELFSRVMGDWSVSNEDASLTLDKLFKASQETGIGMDSLMGKVVQFGAPMRLMGFDLNDAIALFGKWEKEGVNAELVMGSLRIAAGKFAAEGKPLRESLLATFESIKSNEDASKALADAMDIFGARAGPDMAAAIREGRFEFEDLLAVMGDAEGAIASAAAQTEDYGEKWTKFKNKVTVLLEPVGSAIIGIANTVMDRLGPAFDRLEPILSAFGQYIAGVIENGDYLNEFLEQIPGPLQGFAEAIGRVMTAMGELLAGDWKGALETLFGPDVAEQIASVIEGIAGFITETLMPALQAVIDWVSENKDIILQVIAGIAAGLAAFAIISTVISWISGLIAAIGAAGAAFSAGGGIITGIVALLGGPLSAVIAIIALLIGTLAAAWAGNWGGIRDTLTQIWEGTIKPAFEKLKDWLAVFIPQAIETLKGFWENVLRPALETFWNWVQTVVFPLLGELWAWLQETIPAALQVLSDFWENVLKPALQSVWAFIQDDLVPLFTALWELLEVAGALALEALAGLWENVLRPAIESVWGIIRDDLIPIFESLWGWLSEKLGPAASSLSSGALATLKSVFEGVRDAVQWVIDKIQLLTEKLRNVSLPDWLQRRSPSPFEMSFIGANEAIEKLALSAIPQLQTSLWNMQPAAAGNTTINNWDLTAQYGYQTEETLIDRIRLLGMLQNP